MGDNSCLKDLVVEVGELRKVSCSGGSVCSRSRWCKGPSLADMVELLFWGSVFEDTGRWVAGKAGRGNADHKVRSRKSKGKGKGKGTGKAPVSEARKGLEENWKVRGKDVNGHFSRENAKNLEHTIKVRSLKKLETLDSKSLRKT